MKLAVTYVPTSQLRPADYNPRVISDDALARLRRGIREFGIVDPIIATPAGLIIGGHQRWRAAQLEGMQSVPVIHVDLDDDRAKTLNVLLNNPHAQGEWDTAALSDILASISDPTLAGFETAELKELLAIPAGIIEEESPEPIIPDDPKSRRGEVYQLGPHRLMCGDATDPNDVAKLLDGDSVDLLVTSPPYNVGIKYSAHDDRESDRESYLDFIAATLTAWIPQLGQGRYIAWNVGVSPKTHHIAQAALIESAGLTFDRQIVWQKSGVPVPSFYHTTNALQARKYHPNYTHELVYLFSNGEPEPGAPIELPPHGAHDVWSFIQQAMGTRDIPAAPEGTPHHSNLDRRTIKAHPAAFPVLLPRTLIGYLTAENEIVSDCFGGSGSTLIAAEQTGRVARLMEIDPRYCDVARQRYADFVGRTELAP